ncbi:hypothetical protein L873DRAFT_330657 [Choiromyces venosus 120613-1]|uniref:Uncharacterized protein n=1 Tax=Choiromyces venosus 120613-1 TaxID=1336337 RepID=A0A3N4K3H9_9PEZI|nr:hypothetical protein L873DRAFT_330657 [Choiromyces venosus 120613-1]
MPCTQQELFFIFQSTGLRNVNMLSNTPKVLMELQQSTSMYLENITTTLMYMLIVICVQVLATVYWLRLCFPLLCYFICSCLC